MNHSAQPHIARRHAPRYHTDPVFDQVLAVFVEQGNSRLGPSYLAYELDMTTQAAEKLLDEMVKRSLLELDFDDNGELYYSLSADVLFELEQHSAPSSAPSVDSNGWSNGWAGPSQQADGPGFDGTVGRGEPRFRRQAAPSQAPSDPNGCDGTVGHPGDRPQNAAFGQPRTQPRNRAPNTRRHGYEQVRSSNGELVRQTKSNLPARRRQAEPMIAALLSVLLVGTGQLYNREVGKGIAFFVTYAVLMTTFFPVGWIINVWAAVDAYSTAKNRNAESAS